MKNEHNILIILTLIIILGLFLPILFPDINKIFKFKYFTNKDGFATMLQRKEENQGCICANEVPGGRTWANNQGANNRGQCGWHDGQRGVWCYLAPGITNNICSDASPSTGDNKLWYSYNACKPLKTEEEGHKPENTCASIGITNGLEGAMDYLTDRNFIWDYTKADDDQDSGKLNGVWCNLGTEGKEFAYIDTTKSHGCANKEESNYTKGIGDNEDEKIYFSYDACKSPDTWNKDIWETLKALFIGKAGDNSNYEERNKSGNGNDCIGNNGITWGPFKLEKVKDVSKSCCDTFERIQIAGSDWCYGWGNELDCDDFWSPWSEKCDEDGYKKRERGGPEWCWDKETKYVGDDCEIEKEDVDCVFTEEWEPCNCFTRKRLKKINIKQTSLNNGEECPKGGFENCTPMELDWCNNKGKKPPPPPLFGKTDIEQTCNCNRNSQPYLYDTEETEYKEDDNTTTTYLPMSLQGL